MDHQYPEEDLRFDIETENEILKMKIAAELGGRFFAGENDNTPPEVLHDFLQYVYDSHKSSEDGRPANNFYELAGKPEIKRFTDPDDPEIWDELCRLLKKFEDRHILFDPSAIKGLLNKYNFFVDYVLLGKCYGYHHPGMLTVYPLLAFAPHSWIEMYDAIECYLKDAFAIISSGNYSPFEACLFNFQEKRKPHAKYSRYYDLPKELSLVKLQIISIEEEGGRARFFGGVILKMDLEDSFLIMEGNLHFELEQSGNSGYLITGCRE